MHKLQQWQHCWVNRKQQYLKLISRHKGQQSSSFQSGSAKVHFELFESSLMNAETLLLPMHHSWDTDQRHQSRACQLHLNVISETKSLRRDKFFNENLRLLIRNKLDWQPVIQLKFRQPANIRILFANALFGGIFKHIVLMLIYKGFECFKCWVI